MKLGDAVGLLIFNILCSIMWIGLKKPVWVIVVAWVMILFLNYIHSRADAVREKGPGHTLTPLERMRICMEMKKKEKMEENKSEQKGSENEK